MGIIPLQFEPDTDVEALGLTGAERLDIKGLEDVEPGGRLLVHVRRSEDDTGYALTVRVRLDSPIDLEYYRHGGISKGWRMWNLVGDCWCMSVAVRTIPVTR